MNVFTNDEWYALLRAADESKPVWYCRACGRGSSAGPCPIHGSGR